MTDELAIDIQPGRAAVRLTALGCLIVAVGAAAHVINHRVIGNADHPLSKILNRFDLINEPSLPQWYAASALLACALLLGVIARARRRTDSPWTTHWTGLSLMFLLFSIDEAIMVHEMAGAPFRQLVNPRGVVSIPWIIPGAGFVVAVGLLYAPFLRHLDRRSRLLFVTAGLVFVSGALGMEMPGGVLYATYGFSTWHYITSYAVEELLETIGIGMFFYALLDYLNRHVGTVRFGCVTVSHTPRGLDELDHHGRRCRTLPVSPMA